MVALLVLLAVIDPPAPQRSAVEVRYVAALERMRATREPATAVYRATLSVGGGSIVARSRLDGGLFLQFGQGEYGPSDEEFFVRTDRGHPDYQVQLDGKKIVHTRLSLLIATWQGIDSWSRFGFEGDTMAKRTSLPPVVSEPGNLRVISVVRSFGLAYYSVSDGGSGRCANNDPGHVFLLSPIGMPMEHPLRNATVDDETGLFCTMGFVAPAIDDPPYSAIANVSLHLAEIEGYYLVQNEVIEMDATAPTEPEQHSHASIVFDNFVFPGGAPSPSQTPGTPPSSTPDRPCFDERRLRESFEARP